MKIKSFCHRIAYLNQTHVMKILSIFLLLQINWYVPAQSQTLPARQKININRDWKFELGDYTEAMKPFYNDHAWRNINLPHNFSISYFQGAQWYTGYGCYRKCFDVPARWKSKRIFIEFEGAFREAQVFVNGFKVGSHQGGYTGFNFDITDKIKTGKNVLAVRVNNNYNSHLAPRNGDYNFTGGIYRDVYLVVTNPVYVSWYGSWVTTPALSKTSGTVNIKTEVRNSGVKAKTYTIKTDIIEYGELYLITAEHGVLCAAILLTPQKKQCANYFTDTLLGLPLYGIK